MLSAQPVRRASPSLPRKTRPGSTTGVSGLLCRSRSRWTSLAGLRPEQTCGAGGLVGTLVSGVAGDSSAG